MKELLLIAVLLAPALGQLGLSPSQMGAVTGRLSRNGQPAAGIRVTAMAIPEPGVRVTDAASFASIALTDTDGRYRLENIPPGRYYVTAGFLDVPTYYPGVASIDGAKAVNVEAGVTAERIDFTTASSVGVTVSGRVIYPPGQSVPGNVKVSLVGPQRPAPESIVNADGSFEVSRVRPGNYTLRVPPWATTVIVGDSDVSGVDIEVPYNLSGNVVVENNGLLPNLSLSLTSTKPGAEPRNMTLSPAGAFSSQLTPGEYRLAVSGIPAGYSLRAMTAGSLDLVANPLKVLAGTPPAPINVLLGVTSPPPWVKVSGKVGGPGFVGGPRYPVTLTGKGLVAPVQSLLSEDGSFELPRVLPGDYTLGVVATAARKVELHVGTTDLTGVDIAIPVMKDVNARVAIEGQQGGWAVAPPSLTTLIAAGGSAFVVPIGTPMSLEVALADASGTTSITVTRQADGTFRTRLPEGERTVKAEVTGYTIKSLSYGSIDLLKDSLLKVSSADTSEVAMTLVSSSPQGALVGTLTSSVTNMLSTVRILVSNVAGGTGNTVTYMIAGGPTASTNTTVYVGPDVSQSNLLTSVPPAYPPAAAGVQGSVVLCVVIDKAGTVTDVSVVRGHPLLNDAAIAAVKQWRYRPHVLNSQPTAVTTTITINKN